MTPRPARSCLATGGNMEDPEFLKQFLVMNARRLGMAGKLLFPIPDRGLAQRLYRITARTLIVWGKEDVLIPPVYGDAFKKAISKSKLVQVAKAGHAVGQEKPAGGAEGDQRTFSDRCDREQGHEQACSRWGAGRRRDGRWRPGAVRDLYLDRLWDERSRQLQVPDLQDDDRRHGRGQHRQGPVPAGKPYAAPLRGDQGRERRVQDQSRWSAAAAAWT